MTAWDTIKSVATKLVHDELQTLQVRLFRLIALAVAIICLFVVVPVNLLVGLPWGENFITVLLAGFGFFLYQQSLKGKNYFFLLITVLVFGFDLCWFMEDGSLGSMTFYFFPVILYSITTFRGRKLWLANGFLVLNTSLLFVLEYFYPSMVTPFHSPESRLLDLTTGCVCVFFTIGLISWLIVASYDWERERIARFARELGISEKNYRDVVEKAKSLIVRLDGKGNITFFNKYAEDLLGIKRQEVLQRPFLGTVVIPPAGDGQMAGLIQSLLTDPAKHPQTEFESVNRDGRRIRVIWFNQPVYDEAGGLNEILCVGTDVTERSALVERLQVTQRTVDTAGDQVLWMDQAGCIAYANPAAEHMLGHSAEVLRNLDAKQIFSTEFTNHWERLWESLRRDQTVLMESEQRCADGSALPVELTANYLNLGGKEMMTVFVRDIRERKKAEAQRHQLEQQVQKSHHLESLGLVAGGIAHDFNNVLTAILGNLELVKMELPPQSEAHNYLAQADTAVNRACGLTTQLLTFSKGGKPVKKVIQIEAIVRTIISSYRDGDRVKYEFEIKEPLWPVQADPNQLNQVVSQLIQNARQAMPDGGRITVHADNYLLAEDAGLPLPPGRYLKIRVVDSGKGIHPEHLDKIFNPYYTTKPMSTGLGLTIVYSIIKHHQGHISVSSSTGAGATFTLWLPATENRGQISETEPPVNPPANQGVARIFRRVLVMDDEKIICDLATALLKHLGCEVDSAADGLEAIKKFQSAKGIGKPFDVIIMDLTIPNGQGGRETIKQLRQLDREVKVVVSSGYSDDPIMADHQAYGFNAVMPKPYSFDKLQQVVAGLFI